MITDEQFLADVRKYAGRFPDKVRGSYHAYNPTPQSVDGLCPRCGSPRLYAHSWKEQYRDKADQPMRTFTKHGLACLDCWWKAEGR